MRDLLGGAGLGATILYRETRKGKGNVSWDHPDNRLVLGTGPLAGLPVWGTGGLTVVTIGALTNGPTSTQANGFFGTNLKYCGYDAIVIRGQAKDWVYLYIDDDRVEIRDAKSYLGKDTWETQDALTRDLGMLGHQLSVYSISPAGEHLVRWAAIQGDYGHVASKNGVGAVMGKKKLKAVAIVKGTKALRAADPRGVIQAADDIAHDLKTDPSARSLYEYGTLPGVVNLSKMGALPIRNYTTSVTGNVDMKSWEAPRLREGFDHRGHQCNACGMHHCHMSVIRQGPYKGKTVDEPEYEGWSGAGWTIGATDQSAVAWLNTQTDRACVDVNEFGWVIGWVMEGLEKGWLTKQQVGFDLKWGDVAGAQHPVRRRGRRQARGGLPGPPRVRRLAGHLHLHDAHAPRERLPRAVGGDGLVLHGGRGDALRPAHRRHQPRDGAALRAHARSRTAVVPLRLHAARRPRGRAGGWGTVGEEGRHLVQGSRLRPEDRQAPAADAEGPGSRLALEGPLGRQEGAAAVVRRARPGDAAALARMANALNRHEALNPRAFTAAIVRRDAFGRRRAFRALVAEADGRVVGYASFGIGYNTGIAARELWMHDLFVLPAWRGRGVGSRVGPSVGRSV